MASATHVNRRLGENEIRLFRFKRGVRPILGSLIICNLSESPRYSALSYTWAGAYSVERTLDSKITSIANESHEQGESEPVIHIDGSPWAIKHNLYSALHDLDTHRNLDANPFNEQSDHNSEPVHPIFDALWIDAICISQDDPEEKSAQIKLMDRIFSQAQTVLVYLGSEHAFFSSFKWCMDDFTPRLDGVSEESLKLYYGDGILKPQLHYRLGYDKDEPIVKKLTEAIRFVAQCRWFQRTWTLQETILASDALLFVGTQSLPFTPINRFAKHFVERHWSATLIKNIRRTSGIQIPQDMLLNAYKRSRIQWESARMSPDLFRLAAKTLNGDTTEAQILDSDAYQAFRLTDMLFTCASTQCSDKRDKIFACIGMAKAYCPRLADRLVVEYNSTWEDVYFRVSTTILSYARSLDILALVPNALSNTKTGLPTWMLNFDSDPTDLPFWSGVTDDDRSPNVSGDFHKPTLGFSIVGSCLRCSGARFGEIKATDLWFDDSNEFDEALYLVRFAQLIPPSALGRSRLDALWRTYILDGVQNRPTADESILKSFVIFLLCKFAMSLFSVKPMEGGLSVKERRIALRDEFFQLFGELDVPTTPENSDDKESQKIKKKEIQKAVDIVDRYVYGRKLLTRMDTPASRLSKMLTKLMYWHYRKISSSGHLLDQFDLYYNEFVHATAHGRHRLFVTDRGFCGAGPFPSNPRDQIWCLSSANSPYLLRPTGNLSSDGKRPQFRLVGECYVLDFMHGRMMEPEYGVVDSFQEIEII